MDIVERTAKAMAAAYVDDELDNVEISPAQFAEENWQRFAQQARAALGAIRPEIIAAIDHIIGSTGALPGSDSEEVVQMLQRIVDAVA